ncbi:MAG: hypothetical protein IJT44_02290 [Clostridia bacterium]|nr:hypothetical protein [Clostridia bacterium]
MKRILKLLLCILLAAAITGVLNFAIIPVNYNHIFLHQWKAQYAETDTIVLGDSLTLRSVQPSIMDREMGVCAFNTATAQQDIRCTFYYLKDILASCPKIQTVYLGVDYWNFIISKKRKPSVPASLIVFDRLQTLRGRAEYAHNMFSLDASWNIIFRFRNNLDSVYSVAENVRNKLSPAYRRFEAVSEHDYNTDKGYAYSDAVGTNLDNDSHDLTRLDEESLRYYADILDLCREAGVRTCVFQSPYTKERLSLFQGYDNYQTTVREIAESRGAQFYDFNMHPLRETLDDASCFKDAAHLNYTGSCIFMKWFCTVFSA